MIRWLTLALVALNALLLSVPTLAEWHSDEQNIMGTSITARLWHPDPDQGKAALTAVMDEMRRIDRLYSPYREDSELSRLNHKAPEADESAPLSISSELTHLLAQSLKYGDLTGGAFDITYASLGRHFDYRVGEQPDEAQLAELLPAIDYQRIHLDEDKNTVFFDHPKVYVDLGGIAKGYAVDRAIEILHERGIEHASVGAGGDTRLLGDKRGQPWTVGIKNPRDLEQIAVTLPLMDEAISTSGDYERYFIDNKGRRVHHILNPRTGSSAQGIISATVLGPTALDTDALSTSLFVMGAERGLKLIDQLNAFEAILITAEGKVRYSAGLMPPVAD